MTDIETDMKARVQAAADGLAGSPGARFAITIVFGDDDFEVGHAAAGDAHEGEMRTWTAALFNEVFVLSERALMRWKAGAGRSRWDLKVRGGVGMTSGVGGDPFKHVGVMPEHRSEATDHD